MFGSLESRRDDDATPPLTSDDEDFNGLTPRRRVPAVIALSLGSFLAVLDASIAYVALPTIAKALNIKGSLAVLVVVVYQLILVMTMLPLAAIGEILGHRRLYLAGMALFAAATPLAALADNLWVLLTARALQALGGAAALAVTPALIRAIYPREALGLGLGLNSTISAGAFAVAPICAGLILQLGSWHLVFASALPCALAALGVGWFFLPSGTPASCQFDAAGATLCALAIGLIVGGLQLGVQAGLFLLAGGLVAAGLSAGAILVRRVEGTSSPVLPLDLLRERRFALASISALLAFVGQTLLMASLPFHLQQHHGYTPIETGFAVAPWAVVAMVVAPLAGALSDRLPAWQFGFAGLLVGAAGMLALAMLPADPGYVDVGWRIALTGLGFNLFYAPNIRMVIAAAPAHRTSAAGSLLSTLRLGGHMLGATVVTILFAAGIGDGQAPYLLAAAAALAAAIGCWRQRQAD